MIIYTNEGNPFGLHLLLCSKFAGKNVTVQFTNLNDANLRKSIGEFHHLPILRLDSNNNLFMISAASNYLFLPSPDKLNSVNQFIESFVNILAPALVSSASDENAKSKAVSFVNKFESLLQSNKYLCGAELTAADLCAWSLLFSVEPALFQGSSNTLRWFNDIKSLPEVQDALKVFKSASIKIATLQQSDNFGVFKNVSFDSAPKDEVDETDESVTQEELKLAKEKFIVQEVKPLKDPKVVLPVAGERNILITSALPYVNNVPHLGNIIGCVMSADIFARYCRQRGYNTLYISGTDEYGTATETKALAENLTPKQICDKYFEIHNSIYRWFGIGFDYFGRTTTAEQTKIVQEIFMDVYNNGYVQTQSVEQLLCEKCDRYLADRFVEGVCPLCGYEDARGDQCDSCGKLINATELIKPRCKVCSNTPVVRQSEQFFLDLPKIEPQLRDWFDKVKEGWTNNAKVITNSWIREGLKPRCITRDLKWGIPVPLKGYEKKVFYVWFDAPIGYISITSRYTKDWQQWWQPADNTNVELFQFMAKDNVPFHAVMFPCSLLATKKNFVLVKHLMATEYLNYENGKFSKSRGLGVFGNDVQETGIDPDIYRFYLAAARPEAQDSSFSWSDLITRNNSELLNNLGNFINRALVFCEKNFESKVPVIDLKEADVTLLALINREISGYNAAMEKTKFRDGIKHLLTISRHGNQYMQSEQPWVLAKGNEVQKSRAGTVIGMCCNIAALLASLLYPFMPATSRKINAQLNIHANIPQIRGDYLEVLLATGHAINKPSPIFVKIDIARVEEFKQKYGGTQTPEVKKETPAVVAVATPPISGNPSDTSELEEQISKQAEKVRTLKSSADKSVWQPEVGILLDLKKKLAGLLGTTPTDGDKKSKKKGKK